MQSWLIQYRRMLVSAGHLGIFTTSLAATFLLRFDFQINPGELKLLYKAWQVALPMKLFVFHAMGLHRGWWRFAGMPELSRIFLANVLSSAGLAAALVAMTGGSFPRSIYVIDFLVCFLLTAGARFAIRLYNEVFVAEWPKSGRKGVLIYGAGSCGMLLARELRTNPGLHCELIGFLDDDPKKAHASLFGVPVMGGGRDAVRIVEKYKSLSTHIDEVIIAMPSATGRQMREALANCRAAGVNTKTVPGFDELLDGRGLSRQLRDVSIEDILGREPVQLEQDRIREYIARRSIMVTGGAGSIGSELCRQIAALEPRRLVILDQAESDLYRIELELRERFLSLELVAEVGDICDTTRVEAVIRDHAVEFLFHAAAYKHVPMMECNVPEAVKNNIIGTWNVARAAERNCLTGMLMISSDKAVNPTSVMGVTKRVTELLVSAMSRHGRARTKFVSVRFGNVLGSKGSVVPLFQSQILDGGPVTVTHPDMRRYFMTAREAVQLVLQAATMGRGSEILVLDMGEPVRILDLARNMIRLSGLEPDEDIEVRIVGLRPGEKLYEELVGEGETVKPTHHHKIRILEGASVSREVIEEWISELNTLLGLRDERALRAHLRKLVPEYRRVGAEPALTARVMVAGPRGV